MNDVFEAWGPEACFAFQILDTGRVFRSASERFLENEGLRLTPAEIRTTAHVIRFRGDRQTAIAARMGIEPMTLSASLDSLEALGIIRRHRDAGDRRANRVEPTEKAFEVMAALQPVFDTFYEHVLRTFTPAELDRLAGALATMRANLTTDPAVLARISLDANGALQAVQGSDEPDERTATTPATVAETR